jgi:hypothetical protein
MNFETFDFTSPNQCETDPTITYSIENFSNNLGVPFAVIPLNLTKDDLRDLNDLYVDNTCPCDPDNNNDGPDTPDFGRCEGQFSNGFKPKSYYQDTTYRDDVERHFKGYKSLKSEPALMSRLVDLIVRLTNKVAEIIPGTLISPGFITYAADSGMVKDLDHRYPSDVWHRDGGRSIDNQVECHGKRLIFLATLKGDHTLYCTSSFDSDLKQCIPDTSIFSASPNTGTIHKIGKLYGAFHSGPPMNGQRFVFASSIRYPDCINRTSPFNATI